MITALMRGGKTMNELIYKQDAIDAIANTIVRGESLGDGIAEDILYSVPSAEPKIIHCKNCKHRESNDCPMYYEEWIEIDEGDGYFDTNNIIHDWTTDEGFCHCAELRGEEDEINRCG